MMKIVFTLMILALCLIFSAHGGQWRDTFDGERLDDWRSIFADPNKDWDSDWRLEDGRLHVKMTLPNAFPWRTDLLQWTAHPILTDGLTLVGEGIDTGLLFLFIGKRTDPPDFAVGYIFSVVRAQSRGFDKEGNVTHGGKDRARYGDRRELASSQLKIVYAAGRFRVFTFDILLADFDAPDLRGVNVVGLMVEAGGPNTQFSTSIDTFTITAPGIPDHNLDVEPQRKLATTWGAFKRF